MKHKKNNNGSLRKREVTQPQQHTEYYLFNSQGNLKAYSDDVMSFAYYGYNATNTRTYKLSLYNTNLWINGQQQPLNMQLQQAMFYPNSYINFNQVGEYTKHYYNGMERIASRLGDNNTTIAIDNMLENRKLSLEEQVRNDIQELISEPTQVDLPPMLDILNLQPTGTPNDIYYYHPNHLGSTSFVTDQNQTITQGFLYAPFGEITTEYNVNFGNNVIPKYSFNAKELDEETGMYYFEARYYRAPTFISRDPLMNEKPWLTPYHYCSNNPVGRIDPTGMSDDWYEDADGNAKWDENVTSQADLKQGERYIGKTAEWLGKTEQDEQYRYHGDENGNVTRKDMTCTVFANKIATGFDIDKAVNYLNANAYPSYSKETCGNCAKAVRMAIEAGGIKTNNRPSSGSAKDYGPFLEQWGFSKIDTESKIQKGDVRVIQNYPGGSKHGHMDMYNGERWVSDFLQNGFWPGPGYRTHQPSYQIYRYGNKYF